jgi:hypothetical protein
VSIEHQAKALVKDTCTKVAQGQCKSNSENGILPFVNQCPPKARLIANALRAGRKVRMARDQ